ncbi:MAG: hypothetical protein ACTHN5_15390 [Phycisphaerae bacterium]
MRKIGLLALILLAVSLIVCQWSYEKPIPLYSRYVLDKGTFEYQGGDFSIGYLTDWMVDIPLAAIAIVFLSWSRNISARGFPVEPKQ